MEGLSKKQSNLTFITVREGEFILRVKEPGKDVEEREVTKGKNKGNIVYEKRFDSVEGRILGITRRDSEVSFQESLYSTLDILIKHESGNEFQITVPYSSGYTKSFMTRVEDVDFSKDVDLLSYWIEGDDGKMRGYFGIKQDDKKIDPLYSRGDGILPGVEPIKNKKGEILAYDDDDLLEFYDNILENIQEKISPSKEDEPEQSEEASTSDELVVDEAPEDVIENHKAKKGTKKKF